MPTRRDFILGAPALALALTRHPRAQADWPNKPIRMLVPYAAGGGQDRPSWWRTGSAPPG